MEPEREIGHEIYGAAIAVMLLARAIESKATECALPRGFAKQVEDTVKTLNDCFAQMSELGLRLRVFDINNQ